MFFACKFFECKCFCHAMWCISAAYAVCGVCVSVCLSICHVVDRVKTNKRIFKIFSPLGCHSATPFQFFHTKRGGHIPTRTPPNGRVECRWGRQKTWFWTNIWLYWTFVFWCLQHIYRVTLIGVFLGHFRINMHQTCTQYSRGTTILESSPISKNRFLNLEFCRQ